MRPSSPRSLCATTLTSTRSPCRAPPIESGGTYTSSLPTPPATKPYPRGFMLSKPSKLRLGVRPGGRLGREGLDFSGFLRAMEGGFIARPTPAVLWKRRRFRPAREFSVFSTVFSGVLHEPRDFGYRPGV